MQHFRPAFRHGDDGDFSVWLDGLADHDTPELAVPDGDWLGERLLRCDVDEVDRAEAVAVAAHLAELAELRWLGGRMVELFRAGLAASDPQAPRIWPNLPSAYGAVGRFLPLYVLAALVDDLTDWYGARGIDREVLAATLADVGMKLRTFRQRTGSGGLDRQTWLWLHFTGRLFRLGRLQFERAFLPPPLTGDPTVEAGNLSLVPQSRPAATAPDGTPPRTGDRVLSVHIPEDGAFTPAECEASFAAAGPFFARHFPDESHRWATCQSWLMDEQLVSVLGPDSNIARFQRSFHLWPGAANGDVDVAFFVFNRDGGNLAGVPQDTRLQRALVRHRAAGGRWLRRRGWRVLPTPTGVGDGAAPS